MRYDISQHNFERIIHLPNDKIARRYINGETLKELAAAYRVSSPTITKALASNSVQRRPAVPRAGVFSGASNPSWKGGRDYHQNKAEFCAKAKTHYRANRERILERRKEMRTPEQRKRDTAAMRVRHVKLRAEVLKAYGGKCACCGESESLFLELDHVNGRGNEHRRQIGRGSAATYRHLKKLGWPKADFQILCANCNAGSARNGGVCPHAR